MDHDSSPQPAEGRPVSSAPWIRSFLFALLVYAALRAWIMLTAFDAVVVPVYEIPTIGSYGWALAEGVSLLPWNEHYDNAGAQLLTSWLSVVPFKLFGESYLTLKLVPLAFGVLLLAMVGRLLARQFGGRAALIGMLSVAIAPPIVTKYSMLAKGNHFEGLTLLFIALLAALETPEPGMPRRRLWVAFTGLSLGFAISMYFGAMLTGAVLAVAWWIRFGLFQSLRDAPAALGGLAVGLIPFLAINVGTSGRAKNFGAHLGNPTTEGMTTGSVLEKGRTLLTESVPEGGCFEGLWGLSARVPETVFLALTLISAGIAIWVLLRTLARSGDTPLADRRRVRATLWILLAYPIGVLTVLTLKDLPIMRKTPPVEVLGVRYLLGYFFFALLLIAVAIDQLMRAKGRVQRVAGWALMLGLMFTWPFTAAIASPRWSDRGDGLAYPAVHLRQYSILFHHDLRLREEAGVDTTRMKAALDNLSENGQAEQRAQLAQGLGALLTMAELGYQASKKGQAFSADAVTLDFDASDHPDLLRGVGMYVQGTVRPGRLSQQLSGAAKGKPLPLLQRIESALADPKTAPWVAEGFGMSQQYPLRRRFGTDLNRSRSLLGLVPTELRAATLRGIAQSLREYEALGLGRTEATLAHQIGKFEPADQAALKALLASDESPLRQ